MAPLTIHGNLFEPDAGRAASAAQATNFIIVQTRTALTPADKVSLEHLGAAYQREIAENTYLFRYDPTDLTILGALPFVKFVDIYHPHLKLSSAFEHMGIPRSATSTGEHGHTAGSSQAIVASAPAASPMAPIWIAISLHNDAKETMTDIANQLVQSGVISMETTRIISPIRMDTKAAPADVHKIAALDSVSLINPYGKKSNKLNISRTLLTDNVYSPDMSTGYTGEGQVVAVGDSGFDKGSTVDLHPGFQAGSVLDITNVFGPAEPLDDTDGHGTHVCGCITLSATSSNMAGGRRIRGTAPGAKLVVIRNEDAAGDVWGTTMAPDFLQAPYLGAHAPRVFSDSFNADWPGHPEPYDNEAGDIDEFTYTYQDALVCLCAGNEGKPGATTQIGQETAAKNLTVVGSCDTTRPNTSDAYDPAKPTDNDHYVVDVDSNRGPTMEGRFKPDLVAPGVAILSALSRNAADSHKFGVSADNTLMFKSGTSVATPTVAGCAAVIREALVKRPTHPVPAPPGALVKALLINGAVPLNPSAVVPNNDSGFGRVNVSGSLAHLEIPDPPAQPKGGFFSGTIAAGATVTAVNIKVPPPETVSLTGDGVPHRLRVTLVWYDVRGSATENKLYLKVKKTGGTAAESVCGNKDISIADGSAQTPDLVNTVQRVDWVDIPAGDYAADVTCTATAPVGVSAAFHVAWYLF
ncbi:subtilisin-like protein [Coniochaeta ligniaria NRRL 30616]|uniref:Subtilisin-like protein n=1 Tax=Coniochaeta ligniaria NRRL 30616 TaxID=1408157 RepID=A0A1J7J3G1_9PEZI|nr:subtilisin-like protein [Coniochaeta ligniaria NRRL 30616]